MQLLPFYLTLICVTLCGAPPLFAVETRQKQIADALEHLDSHVLSDEQRAEATGQFREQFYARIRAANATSTSAWEQIKTAEKWQIFRKHHIDALRKSLGHPPQLPRALNFQVTSTLSGDGFTIDNVVYESRPGIWVTANLYKPHPLRNAMPGIIICHAHHTPKEHGELQDMGMTWARRGCLVLVADQLGHGERRQHPFRTANDYAGSFRPSRQDYYFRYDSSLQLYLAGESLAGWIAWDLMRGVDLLLATPGIDTKKILLLGSVAGGGDPAAVAAALDERVSASGIFNFGGPQPETRYPLAEDAKVTFNFAGGGSWESTRNLHRSAADGFLPWVIVASLAPRGLIYAHEFAWDEPHDPVWQRLQTIYQFTQSPNRLTFTHGRGSVKGQPPESTHCTHIGPVHRVKIHEALQEWFGVSVTPGDEYSARRSLDELQAFTPAVRDKLHPRTLAGFLSHQADERLATTRTLRKDANKSRESLVADLTQLLGKVESAAPKVVASSDDSNLIAGARIQRVLLQVEEGIQLPVLIIRPDGDQRSPVVVGLAQEGKSGFLKHRSSDLGELVAAGITIVLPDLRGAGEISLERDRGRTSGDTSRSASELMLRGTMVGARLRDVRSVLQFVRSQPFCDVQRIAVWGESFSPVNSNDTNFVVPRDAEKRPAQSEPIGSILALLSGLFDAQVSAVAVRGGLTSFRSVLDSPYVLVPHDVVVPGLLTVGDLGDIAASLAPKPVRLSGLVDGLNRAATQESIRETYALAIDAYDRAKAKEKLQVTSDGPLCSWLVDQLTPNDKKVSSRRAPADSERSIASTTDKIDGFVAAHWAAQNVEPAALADNAELLRRTTLDLVGRVPTVSEFRESLADRSAEKRQKLVDRLISGPEFSLHFANVLDEFIQGPRAGDAAFVGYLRASLSEQKPWDAMFREILLGPWENDVVRPANRFLDKRAKDVDVLTVDTTRVFFGVDISCARCHDHPLVPAWKQDHYYGMMAFLNRTQGGKGSVSEKTDGEVKFVSAAEGKEKTAPMMFLTGQRIAEPSPVKGAKYSRRGQLVSTALSERTLLSRAIVNRLWKQLVGRGIVEPIDQMHSGSPPAIPGLLEWLADDFAAGGYDLRRLVAAIVSSRAYALSSRWDSERPLPADEHFAVARLRPLGPRPLAVSLLLIAGDENVNSLDPSARVAVFDQLQKHASKLLTSSTGEANLTEPSAAEALFLANSAAVQELFVPIGNNLVARLVAEPNIGQLIDTAIRTVLVREASESERTALVSWFERQTGPRESTCGQLVWALAMSPEFRFNH